jgi:CheY-like chemotaxis protein
MLTRLVGEDVDVEIRRASDEWPVRLDRSHFEQAILNLSVNARDAMPNGGRLTIESVNCTFDDASTDNQLHLVPGEYVMLSVSDTGTGMSEEVKKRVFEPFFTTKEVGKGTGLGLAMVYGIVKQSGGDIAVRSTLGKGTQIIIYLPRVPGPPPVSVPAEPLETPVRAKPTGQILIVEDEETLREVLYEMLTSAGYQVIQSGNVQEAIALSLEHKESIDLLLSDVVLKGGNGRELVRTLNTMGCNFKVLYMSGYTPDSIMQHGVLDPGTYFIQKPFSQAAIVKKVEEILNS